MDLSFIEVVVVCIIAFVVFGPEEFVRKTTDFGRWLGRMKTQAHNYRIMLESEVLQKDTLDESKKKKSDELS